MNRLCCGYRVAGQDVLTEVARFLAEFFEGVDLAPTDVAVGVVLLRQAQKARMAQRVAAGTENANAYTDDNTRVHLHHETASGVESEGHGQYDLEVTNNGPTPGPVVLNESTVSTLPASPLHTTPAPSAQPIPPDFLTTLLHFFDYAESIYGLPLHIVTESPLQLIRSCLCCCCFWQSSEQAYESVARGGCGCCPWVDIWCGAQDREIPWLRRRKHGDLLYISRNNGLFRSPFFVARDPATHSVVIAIRGTLSTADMLVDLSLHVTELDIPDFEMGNEGGNERPKHYAHTGMLKTAKNIFEEISRGRVLEDPRIRGWGLVVCGHSLGAGIASLLAHLLRPTYPFVKCYSFSPPGCLLSSSASRHFASFTTSVVIGNDIVPRLSRGSLERAKRDVVSCVEGCNVRKVDVLGWRGRGKGRRRKTGRVNVDLERDGADRRNAHVVDDTRGEVVRYMEMYAPGRIVYFEKLPAPARAPPPHPPASNGHQRTESSFPPPHRPKKKYVHVPREADAREFGEVIVASDMLSDHFPFNVRKVMENVVKRMDKEKAEKSFGGTS
ncbi:hypothetical protein HK104_011232 [Borealophlyctis nickersoniae]|nr:hypothetical protein HK104_011232 [Borealophlyctis nickersoniae]